MSPRLPVVSGSDVTRALDKAGLRTAFHARYRVEAGGGIGQANDVSLNRLLRRALHNRDREYVTPLDLVARRHG